MKTMTTGEKLMHLDNLTNIIANTHSDDAIYDWNKLTSNYAVDVFEVERFDRMSVLADVALNTHQYKKCVKYAHHVLTAWAKAVNKGMNVECPIKAN